MSERLTLETAPDVLTVPQVAEVLNIGTKQAYAACRDEVIPAIRLGRTVRVSKAALQRMLDPDNAGTPAGQGEGSEAGHRWGTEGAGHD